MLLAAVVAVGAMWIVAVRPALESQLEGPEPAEPSPPPMQAPPPTAAKPVPPVLQPAAAPAEPEPAPAEPPAEPQPSAAYKPLWSDMIKGDQGPVAEYRKRYESEARDDDATRFESHVQSAFERAKALDMLQAVSCHKNICKLTLRWSDARTSDYIKSLGWIGLGGNSNPNRMGFEMPLALSPAGEKDKDGVRPVELFLVRRN